MSGRRCITVKTDENGRAEFKDFITGTAGASVKATADVDGEHLESQEFPAPTRGGIRLMLVATDPNKKSAPAAPAVSRQRRHRRPVAVRDAAARRGCRRLLSPRHRQQPVGRRQSADAVRDRYAGRRGRHRDHGRLVAAGQRQRRAGDGRRPVPAGPYLRADRVDDPGRRRLDRDRAEAARQSRAARRHRQEIRRDHREVAAAQRAARDAGGRRSVHRRHWRGGERRAADSDRSSTACRTTARRRGASRSPWPR